MLISMHAQLKYSLRRSLHDRVHYITGVTYVFEKS
jgi:hypothetical protein